MKVCILGNSHAASLLKACDSDPAGAAGDWDFFVAPNGYMDKQGLRAIAFDPDRGALLGFPHFRAPTGADLEIRRYEAFVLVGAHVSPALLVKRFSAGFSPDFSTVAIAEICRASMLYLMFQNIRSVSDARILLITHPAPLADSPAPNEAANDLSPDLAGMTALVADFWKAQGVEFLAQPPETMDDKGGTRLDCVVSQGNPHYSVTAAARIIDQIRAML